MIINQLAPWSTKVLFHVPRCLQELVFVFQAGHDPASGGWESPADPSVGPLALSGFVAILRAAWHLNVSITVVNCAAIPAKYLMLEEQATESEKVEKVRYINNVWWGVTIPRLHVSAHVCPTRLRFLSLAESRELRGVEADVETGQGILRPPLCLAVSDQR